MKTVSQRYDSLQVARFIGASLVVVYHFGAVELLYGSDRLVSPLLSYAATVIDLFFVVSGFLMGTLYRNNSGGIGEVLEFSLRRVLRIYPSYWLVTLAVLAVWIGSHGHLFSQMVGRHPDVAASLLILPSASRPVVQVAWTLLHEVYFYAGFAVVLLVRPALRPMVLALWAGIVLIGCYGPPQMLAHPAGALVFSPYTLEFIAGVALGWGVPRMRRHAPRLALLAGSALWVAGIVMTGFDHNRKLALPEHAQIALDGCTAVLWCYGLVAADLRRLWTCPAFLSRGGDWSYALYLVHTLVIGMVCFVWRPLSQHGVFDNAVVLIVSLGASIAISAIVFNRLERPASRLATPILQRLAAWSPRIGALLPAARIGASAKAT
jgi:peptidoglycan/LPS O-acetylase OafA/YrhL